MDALAAILDFDAEGRTAFEKLGSTAISTASDIAGGFSSELTGFLGRIDMGQVQESPMCPSTGNISGDITPTQTVPSAPREDTFPWRLQHGWYVYSPEYREGHGRPTVWHRAGGWRACHCRASGRV